MATLNSGPWRTPKRTGELGIRRRFSRTLAFCSLAVLMAGGLAEGGLPEAESRYQSARAALSARKFDLELSWKLAEACFDRAEYCAASKERAALAEEGIAVAREVVRRTSNNVAGHFYLALNLGQLARTRVFTALGLVSEMEHHFLAAVGLDPGFRDAGPERSLGMLYAQAPGWPTSIGSRSKARLHLQRAVDLASGFPENLIALLEAEMGFGDRRKVASRFPELEGILANARNNPAYKNLTEEWRDWTVRSEALKKYHRNPCHPVGETEDGTQQSVGR